MSSKKANRNDMVFSCGSTHLDTFTPEASTACKTIAKLKGLIDDAYEAGWRRGYSCGADVDENNYPLLAEWKQQQGI
jgi:hypothetical protein